MSNYDTDVFTPIFAEIHRVAGVGPYTGLVAGQNGVDKNDEEAKKDMAYEIPQFFTKSYRVVAEHIRTLTMRSRTARCRATRWRRALRTADPEVRAGLLLAAGAGGGGEQKEKTHFVREAILEELAFTVVDGGCGDSQTRWRGTEAARAELVVRQLGRQWRRPAKRLPAQFLRDATHWAFCLSRAFQRSLGLSPRG